ncbi:MAG: DUF1624 domain-containing protein [Cyclobacteriaceae bacterium]|nr:DUF1624 domain-containing protein [Cyclobacteriaceae bacterium]
MNQPLTKKERILSVDMLRGMVIIIMALDHMRDYTTYYHFNPEDLSQTTIPLFITRWVTHFCAPVFMFVAGVGSGLGEINGKSKKQLSHFLWTRGLWLVLLEFTVIKFGWTFNFTDKTIFLIVIWALGMCMISLAVLIYVPKKWLLIFGLIMVFGHNLLDNILPEAFGILSPLWKMFHVDSVFPLGSFTVLAKYPMIPWIGVMALGYVFADFYRLEAPLRQRKIFVLGLIISLLFFVIRGFNIYGDPHPWTVQSMPGMTAVSFFNVNKYPPSLSYLLMTLGPSIMLLAVFERIKGWLSSFLVVFGRVPMFFYVVHIYAIHLICVILGLYQGFTINQMANDFESLPSEYGFGLGVTYVLWIFLIVALYFLCKSYIKFKKGKKHPFYSYI